MTQKIINGFPQYFSYTYLNGKYYGTEITEANELHTDINLQFDLVGDSITVKEEEIELLTIMRDGSILLDNQGFQFIAENQIRVIPGLLENEVVQIKKFVGVSGAVETVQVLPPIQPQGYPQLVQEATFYTDNSTLPVNGVAAVVYEGKTRLITSFVIDEGRTDVYINSSRVSVNDGIWSFIDSNTIELNDDYSSTRMKVDVVNQRVG